MSHAYDNRSRGNYETVQVHKVAVNYARYKLIPNFVLRNSLLSRCVTRGVEG